MTRPIRLIAAVLALLGAAVAHAASADLVEQLKQAQALIEARDYVQAERGFAAALNATPPADREALAWAHFGRAFARHQLSATAATDAATLEAIVSGYQQASALDERRYLGAANFNAGLILRRLGKNRPALDAFLLAAKSNDPQRPRFLFNAGLEYEALGMPQNAADTYRQVIAAAPSDNEARKSLLVLYSRQRWDEMLVDTARAWSAELRILPYVNYTLIELLQRKAPVAQNGLAESALTILANNHASLALGPSDFARSVNLEYAKVVAVHPRLRAPIRALEAAYSARLKDERYAEGPDSRWWRENAERTRTWSTVLKSLGNSYWRQASYEVAASYYEAAIGYHEPYRLQSWVDLDALAMLAATNSNLKRLSRVRQLVPAVDRWVKEGQVRTPGQREAIRDFYFNAAWGYTDVVDYDPAVELYRKSLELDPRFAEAHVNLGFIYMGSLDLAAAIKHFERALELDATNPTTNNNLGFATLIHGDFDKAIRYLRRAYELNNYLLVTVNLGDAYRYAGNSERALQLHQEARDGIRERGNDEKYMTSHWRYNYMPLGRGDTQTIRKSILVKTKDEKRAFVHYALSFDQALVGDLVAAQSDFDTAVRLASDPEFRCFFANKIAAIDRFLKVPPRASQWLDARRLELRRELTCEGS